MKGIRHITLPAGFVASGVACGVKASGNKDVAIIACEVDAAAAIVTTRNQVVGAPVIWCRSILPRAYGTVRGIVINAGNSNVCTGQAGLRDAKTMAAETAKRLGTAPKKVLVASTGIIGHRLPMTKIRRGIAAAAKSLGTRHDGDALEAIMTTDTRPKSAVVQSKLGGKLVTVAGFV
jgi:glutamate N-acetyltransferase / amino-acid N-acetyltransferase